MNDVDNYACFMTGIEGNFSGTGDGFEIWVNQTTRYWEITTWGNARAEATCIPWSCFGNPAWTVSWRWGSTSSFSQQEPETSGTQICYPGAYIGELRASGNWNDETGVVASGPNGAYELFSENTSHRVEEICININRTPDFAKTGFLTGPGHTYTATNLGGGVGGFAAPLGASANPPVYSNTGFCWIAAFGGQYDSDRFAAEVNNSSNNGYWQSLNWFGSSAYSWAAYSCAYIN
jgi:hypothetical protein